jgi:RNA polymerase sigma-70 factor, ECF subfamily
MAASISRRTGIFSRAGRLEGVGLSDHDLPTTRKLVREEIVALLPRLRRFCLALTRSADAGDDLTQSTIERALSRIDQWQDETRLDSWMFRIAQNIFIDEIRARKRRGVQVDVDMLDAVQGDDGRQILESRSDLERARQAINALSDDQRALVALVIIDGQSYKQAAEILDIPIGTVMSRIARARQAIDAFVNGAPHALPA